MRCSKASGKVPGPSLEIGENPVAALGAERVDALGKQLLEIHSRPACITLAMRQVAEGKPRSSRRRSGGELVDGALHPVALAIALHGGHLVK